MFTTRLTDLLGIEFPIIGGTMMDLSMAPFVAAISEAGALGIIASAIYLDEQRFRDDLKAVKAKTGKPFGVNINLFPMMRKLDNLRYLEIMAEEGVRIVETSGFNPPEELVAKIKQHKMTWLHKCVGVRYAKKAEKLGADAITVVGYENGGATGTLNVTTLVLVPSTVDAVKVPVIGGGGVVDGRTLLAVLSLGASGAIVGSRLMLSEECPIHANLKQALLQATELDTDVVMRSVGFAHRIWLNEPAKKVVELEAKGAGIADIYPYVSGEAARKLYETGDLQSGTVSCSQAIGLVHEIKPVRDILVEMMGDAQRRYAALAGQA
jgi:NAD(P)H-dependent flavin oxidoreductase YrpB (nitropropane dioxygenase family)